MHENAARGVNAAAWAVAAGIALGAQAPAQVTTRIDFELGSPSTFGSTLPLTNEYAAQGVSFAGPAPGEGGAVLNQSGNFGVDARSGVEFLAFNHSASMGNGSPARGPETLTFDLPAREVSIWAAGGFGAGASFRLDAFLGAALVGSTTSAPQSGWAQLLVQSPGGIDRVVIAEVGGDETYVMDDLEIVSLSAALLSSVTQISASSGGVQDMTVSAGAAHAGRLYLILGSVTGTDPPFPIDGKSLPLLIDIYTVQTLNAPNAPPLANSLGLLDASGVATASFTVPPGLPASFVGLTFFHAFVVVTVPPDIPLVAETSAPLALTLTP